MSGVGEELGPWLVSLLRRSLENNVYECLSRVPGDTPLGIHGVVGGLFSGLSQRTEIVDCAKPSKTMSDLQLRLIVAWRA